MPRGSERRRSNGPLIPTNGINNTKLFANCMLPLCMAGRFWKGRGDESEVLRDENPPIRDESVSGCSAQIALLFLENPADHAGDVVELQF